MKIIRIIKKSIVDAFKSVFRNFSLSLASISCTTITLILLAFALLVTYNVNSITDNFKNVLSIDVFFDKTASEEDISAFIIEANNMKNIDETLTDYRTADKNKTELTTDNEFYSNLFSIMDTNPLLSEAIFKVKDINELSKTAEAIKGITINGVKIAYDIKYGENYIDKAVKTVNVVKKASYVSVICLVFVTFFLIGNTIKLTIFSRRNEINIMRLVGTSNTVIKLPFVVEGFALGIFGALIPVLLTIYGYQFLYDLEGGYLFTNLFSLVKPSEIIYMISLVLLLVGAIVGMFASVKSVKRYLKV